ncbi:hypothetical protein SAMN02910456_01025 [Ruminococcaceae bacterium YRB3002]|nr:hypothetical protein SAMN02910456_01025 [Ruminococcaceae bacterium YRB3002]
MWIPILLSVIFVAIITVLVIKIVLLSRAFTEIDDQVRDHMDGSDSSSFKLSTSNPKARSLANNLDAELQQLHKERIVLQDGDRRMKANVTAISHDLRTPLTAINSYVDLLSTEPDEAKRAEYLERIKDRTSELKYMTSELFKYSVSSDNSYESRLNPEDLDLQRIIEDSLLSFFGELSSRGITPSTSFPSSPVIVNCDRKTLMRIFDNIFSNVAKYATSSLSVTLSSSRVVTITNDAPSLTPVQVSKMFDKYYTVNDGKESTGLGLSIARDLVESIGGSISASVSDGFLSVEIKM